MSADRASARIVVLGGGLTGLSAAWQLREEDCLLVEQAEKVGGLAATDECAGFFFDRGSHIWFTDNADADGFVKNLPGLRMQAHKRSAWVHMYNRKIPAPFQANLFGLPLHVVSDCLAGYMSASRELSKECLDFDTWLISSFGDGIYRHFMRPYNMKVWTVAPEELTTDWHGARIDVPDIREVVDGAIGVRPNSLGMNSQFLYPVGGVQSLVTAVAQSCPNTMTGARAAAIDLQSKCITLQDGRLIRYERLINTIPLPELVGLLSGANDAVLEAARSLRWTKVVLVSICLKLKPEHGYHWIYFPEAQYPFFRVHFPHNYSDAMCPSECGSVQAECAFSAASALDLESIAEEVCTGLSEAGYLDPAQVLAMHTTVVDPAYVLYDHGRRSNLEVILPFLRDHEVYSCGRFGGWQYLNMDGCIMAGKAGADWAIQEMRN